MKIDVGEEVRAAGACTGASVASPRATSTSPSRPTPSSSGFNVRAEGKATELANREGVDIRYYSVIYQAIDEIEQALKGMLKPSTRRSRSAAPRSARSSGPPGSAPSPGAWSPSGEIRRNAKARLLRDNVVVAENLTVSSLRRFKDDATEVREGFECGHHARRRSTTSGSATRSMTYEMREKPRE